MSGALGLVLAVSAVFTACQPVGNWVLMRTDPAEHWACKTLVSSGYGPVWRVEVRSVATPEEARQATQYGIGTWTAVVVPNGTNAGRVVGEDQGNASEWGSDHTIVTTVFASPADSTVRIWSQESYYGPSARYRDGTPIGRIPGCA